MFPNTKEAYSVSRHYLLPTQSPVVRSEKCKRMFEPEGRKGHASIEEVAHVIDYYDAALLVPCVTAAV